MLFEQVEKATKFYNLIRSPDVREEVLYSVVKQVLMAISIAQSKKRMAHYDLHSENVLVKKCHRDVVFLYVLDDESNQFAVPTYGHYPVIIDFGFSYISDMEDGPLFPSLAHTDAGFMSDRFDWVADPKLFLVTVSSEIKKKRDSKRSHKFRRIVRNIFAPLDIDWESGWDATEDYSAADEISRLIKDYNTSSDLFENYDHYAVDILQTLVIMPIEKQPYEEIGVTFRAFLREWIKIENEISDPFFNLYILQGVVEAARHVRAAYYSPESRESAIVDFQRLITTRINKVVRFCKPKRVHHEKLLCSLIVLATCMEGVFYEAVTRRMCDKEAEYTQLDVKCTDHVYGAVAGNLRDSYTYSDKTKVFVFDTVRQETGMLFIDQAQATAANEIHSLCVGPMLYELYKNKQRETES